MANFSLTAAVTALVIILSGLPLAVQAKETPPPVQEASVQAAWLFNFGKFVTWPADRRGSFRICIWNDSVLADSLRGIAEKKKIRGLSVDISQVSDSSELSSCKILFLPKEERSRVQQVRERSIAEGILTVGEYEGFLQKGGMIVLLPEATAQATKISLEINEAEAVRAGLKIDARLLDLARRVIPRSRAHP